MDRQQVNVCGKEPEMNAGESTTGTRDEHYDLVSVLYHALEGADTCSRYARDAEASGRADLVEFFREAQTMHAGLAERAKERLGISSFGREMPGEVPRGSAGRRPTDIIPPYSEEHPPPRDDMPPMRGHEHPPPRS